MDVRVVRSPKRRKTVSASLEQGVLVLRIPARMTKAQEGYWVERMRQRFQKERLPKVDPESALQQRTERLNQRYFGGQLRFRIDWVDNQRARWGSCTPTSARIRLNRELAGLPDYVVDYVIVHELAHLLEANHGPRFWALVARYPATERARGFLEGYQWVKQRGSSALEVGDLIEENGLMVAIDREDEGHPHSYLSGGYGDDEDGESHP